MFFKKILLLIVIFALFFVSSCQQQEGVIKIAIVHSLSGTQAINEKPMVDALLLAVDEVNQSGGVLGKKIKPIVIDGKSNAHVVRKEVERLIVEEKVSAVFACGTSRCRKVVKPIVEKYNNLLFYSVQFEGLETSNNILYFASAPNQQIIPGVSWMLNNFGSPLFLVGTDTLFSRATNKIIRNMVYMKGKRLAGERYVSLGSTDMSQVMADIKEQTPAGIINTLSNNHNRAFFKALETHNFNNIPVMSYRLGERDVDQIDIKYLKNHFVTVNYLESLTTDQNKAFIQAFRHKYGVTQRINGAMVSAYSAVKLWAKTVNDVKSSQARYVRNSISNKSLNSPSGIISVDPESGYIWQTVYVGKIKENGSIEPLWYSNKPIRPKPFPIAHTQESWLNVLDKVESGLQRE